MNLFCLLSVSLLVSLYLSTASNKIETNIFKKNNCSINELYFEPILTTEKPKINYENVFNYYSFNTETSKFYAADVFEHVDESQTLVEVKLVVDNAFDQDYLVDHKYIVEYIKRNCFGELEKYYYVPSDYEVNCIIANSKEAPDDETTYKRLITSLNFEVNELGKKQKFSSYYLPKNSNNVNRQEPLDYFMEIKDNNSEFVYNSITNENVKEPHTDNAIVNLIDKSVFKTVGEHYECGSEWGYFAKTVKKSNKDCITSLLIFDIELEKADLLESEDLSIRQIYNCNYLFSNEYNIVKKDISNNYCIGNPELCVDIKYINTLDNQHISRLNPGENGYSVRNDLGFCFNSVSAKFLGVGKNSDSNVTAESVLATFYGMALDVVIDAIFSSNLVGFIAGVATDFISSYVYDYLKTNACSMNLAKRSDGVYESSVVSIGGAGNYKIAQDKAIQEQRGLEKTVFLRLPGYDKSYKENNNNRQTPLLFKNQNHSVNYKFDLFTSESNENYSALLIHKLKLDVFDDNSFFLFNRDPSYINTIDSEFSYVVSKDGYKTQDLLEGKDNQSYIFGSSGETEINFLARKTGRYRIIITDYLTYTYFCFNDKKYNLTNVNKNDELGNNNIRPSKEAKIIDLNLNENTTYTFSLYRKISSTYYYGTANIKIFKFEETFKHDGTETFGKIYESNKTINDVFGNNLITFENVKEGFHTIYVNNTISPDTYLELYDKNMNLIAVNDDGYSSHIAGIVTYFKSNCIYYINVRYYSDNTRSNLTLNAKTGIYINLIKGDYTISTITIKRMYYANNIKLLFAPSSSVNLKLYFKWEPVTNLTFRFNVYDLLRNKVVYSTSSPLLTTPSAISFEANGLYQFEISGLNDPTNYTKGIYLIGVKA